MNSPMPVVLPVMRMTWSLSRMEVKGSAMVAQSYVAINGLLHGGSQQIAVAK
jgi:hypothetical protein